MGAMVGSLNGTRENRELNLRDRLSRPDYDMSMRDIHKRNAQSSRETWVSVSIDRNDAKREQLPLGHDASKYVCREIDLLLYDRRYNTLRLQDESAAIRH